MTTAAYGVTQQLWTYIQMPAMALGWPSAPWWRRILAQVAGTGVARITRSGIACNLVITGVLVAILTLVDAEVLGLFMGADSPALPIAQHIQRVASWGFILFGVTLVISATVRANGAVYGPLIILFIAFFPVRLGLMLALLPHYGAEAIWWTTLSDRGRRCRCRLPIIAGELAGRAAAGRGSGEEDPASRPQPQMG